MPNKKKPIEEQKIPNYPLYEEHLINRRSFITTSVIGTAAVLTGCEKNERGLGVRTAGEPIPPKKPNASGGTDEPQFRKKGDAPTPKNPNSTIDTEPTVPRTAGIPMPPKQPKDTDKAPSHQKPDSSTNQIRRKGQWANPIFQKRDNAKIPGGKGPPIPKPPTPPKKVEQ